MATLIARPLPIAVPFSLLAYFHAMKLKAAWSSETSINMCQMTWNCIPEENYLNKLYSGEDRSEAVERYNRAVYGKSGLGYERSQRNEGPFHKNHISRWYCVCCRPVPHCSAHPQETDPAIRS